MNWDKPYSEKEFIKAINIMGDYGYKFKEYHTGIKELLWSKLIKIDLELYKVCTETKYKEYLALCKVRNSKLYRALK